MSSDGKTVQGWNDGLVIEDKDGNQFVWVPVDGTNVKYERWCTKNLSYADCQEQAVPSGVTSEQNQIDKYHGFYIARYEAGTELEYDSRNIVEKPLSKKNKDPWNNISWTNAKDSAEIMYTGSEVKSGLVTGAMWDTTMKWLQNANVNVTTDCRDWGNYINAPVTEITKYSTDSGQTWTTISATTKGTNARWLLPTGHTNYTKRKNIYDLAGNVWEWINEKNSSYFVFRSGSCYNDATDRNASYRNSNSGNNDHSIGFRVGIYIQ